MKKLLLLPLMLVFAVGCAPWYKYDRPVSELPKAEVEQDQTECKDAARLECAKVGGPTYYPQSSSYRGPRRRGHAVGGHRGPIGYGGPDWRSYQATPFERCVKIYYEDCLSERGWHKKRRQRRKEDPKPKVRQETKIELGEGNEKFRIDVVNTTIAYYDSHGLTYTVETLASSIRNAENLLQIEKKGIADEYFEWLKKQPEYNSTIADLNRLYYECVKRHLKGQQEKAQR